MRKAMTSGWRSRSPGPGPGSEGSEALPGPPGPAVDSEARRRCPGAGPAAAQGQHGQHVPEHPAALRLEARRQGGVPGASAAAVRLAGVGGPEVSPDLVQVPPRGGVVAGMLAEQPLDGAGLGPEAGLHLLLVGEACRQEAAGLHGPAGAAAAGPRRVSGGGGGGGQDAAETRRRGPRTLLIAARTSRDGPSRAQIQASVSPLYRMSLAVIIFSRSALDRARRISHCLLARSLCSRSEEPCTALVTNLTVWRLRERSPW